MKRPTDRPTIVYQSFVLLETEISNEKKFFFPDELTHFISNLPVKLQIELVSPYVKLQFKKFIYVT